MPTHLWLLDGNSAGTGAGEAKTPHETPMSITTRASPIIVI